MKPIIFQNAICQSVSRASDYVFGVFRLSRLLDQVYSYPSDNDYRNKGKTTLKESIFYKLKKTVYLKEKYEVYRRSRKLTQVTYEFILTQLINFL